MYLSSQTASETYKVNGLLTRKLEGDGFIAPVTVPDVSRSTGKRQPEVLEYYGLEVDQKRKVFQLHRKGKKTVPPDSVRVSPVMLHCLLWALKCRLEH